MKILLFLILVFIAVGCAHHMPTVSSAGTIGSELSKPLPKNQTILVITVLENVKTNIISENIFTYERLGSISIPAERINSRLSDTAKQTLKKIGYFQVDSKIINASHVLNKANLQTSADHALVDLTPDVQAFLRAELKNQKADTIVVITQNQGHPLTLDLKCELSKHNIYYQSSIQPHLNLYKIYFIEAHSLKVIAWLTGSLSEDLYGVRFCKPMPQLSATELNELQFLVMDGLSESVATDLTKIITHPR